MLAAFAAKIPFGHVSIGNFAAVVSICNLASRGQLCA